MGIGGCGLRIEASAGYALKISGNNPQSPIPNPQSQILTPLHPTARRAVSAHKAPSVAWMGAIWKSAPSAGIAKIAKVRMAVNPIIDQSARLGMRSVWRSDSPKERLTSVRKILDSIRVRNTMLRVPASPHIRAVQVPAGFDVADNYIVRVSPKKTAHSHIIASNLDQAIVVATVAAPRTSLGFIDRFLVTAEAYRIPATILCNKIDLLSDEESIGR